MGSGDTSSSSRTTTEASNTRSGAERDGPGIKNTAEAGTNATSISPLGELTTASSGESSITDAFNSQAKTSGQGQTLETEIQTTAFNSVGGPERKDTNTSASAVSLSNSGTEALSPQGSTSASGQSTILLREETQEESGRFRTNSSAETEAAGERTFSLSTTTITNEDVEVECGNNTALTSMTSISPSGGSPSTSKSESASDREIIVRGSSQVIQCDVESKAEGSAPQEGIVDGVGEISREVPTPGLPTIGITEVGLNARFSAQGGVLRGADAFVEAEKLPDTRPERPGRVQVISGVNGRSGSITQTGFENGTEVFQVSFYFSTKFSFASLADPLSEFKCLRS